MNDISGNFFCRRWKNTLYKTKPNRWNVIHWFFFDQKNSWMAFCFYCLSWSTKIGIFWDTLTYCCLPPHPHPEKFALYYKKIFRRPWCQSASNQNKCQVSKNQIKRNNLSANVPRLMANYTFLYKTKQYLNPLFYEKGIFIS